MARRSRKKPAGSLAIADSYATDIVATGGAGGRVVEMARRYLAERADPGPVRWDEAVLDDFVRWSALRMGTVFAPWQVFVAALMVARRTADGLPATRILALQVPRGAGKTQFAACLAGWTVERNTGRKIEVVVLATQLNAAAIVRQRLEDTMPKESGWKFVGSMSGTQPKYANHANGSVSCKAATAQNADGISPTLVILDECARMDETFNRAMSSLTKVPGAQALCVTTPDADQYVAPWGSWVRDMERRLDEGEPLLDGVVPVLYGIDQGDDPGKPETWAKANPLFASRKDLVAEYERQAATGLRSSDPTKRQEFYTQQLATFNDDTTGAMPVAYLDACTDDWALESVAGLPAVVAVDFSQGGAFTGRQVDMTSMNLAVWDGSRVLSRSWHWWAGNDLEENESRSNQPLREWIDAGLLSRCQGATIDYGEIEARLEAISKAVDLRHFVADPVGKAGAWCESVERRHGWAWSRAPQDIRYMGSAWAIWSDMVRAKRIRFAKDPVVRSALASTRLAPGRTGLQWPAKALASSNNDAIIACLMAVKVMNDREILVESMYANAGGISF